ncbi:hypothetical protein OH76DRAFT_914360 [Lentinus brumalis]|uniref:DUF6533 domain-containing protein n=1 Tax=Lentinus brumalis TaxID=2498619 RepID=A0A371D037_9APHY|nr:hypothetical protein OH76DRAFT_914360 [Polyporus brumalis]
MSPDYAPPSVASSNLSRHHKQSRNAANMSDQDSTADTIAYYYSFQTGDFVFFASIVPLIYDYFLSFDREMGLIWRGKRCGASLIYCIIRYNALLYEMLNASTSIRSLTDQLHHTGSLILRVPATASDPNRRSWPVSLTVSWIRGSDARRHTTRLSSKLSLATVSRAGLIISDIIVIAVT